jgi:hypothetical protein
MTQPRVYEDPDNGIETLLFINVRPEDKYYFLEFGGRRPGKN